MRKECKVSKSVRLSREQIAYIEEQEGKDFSSKLSGLLEEVKSGEAERKKNIAWYEGCIREQEKELNGYRSLINDMRRIRINVISIERFVNDLMDLSTKDASNDIAAK